MNRIAKPRGKPKANGQRRAVRSKRPDRTPKGFAARIEAMASLHSALAHVLTDLEEVAAKMEVAKGRMPTLAELEEELNCRSRATFLELQKVFDPNGTPPSETILRKLTWPAIDWTNMGLDDGVRIPRLMELASDYARKRTGPGERLRTRLLETAWRVARREITAAQAIEQARRARRDGASICSADELDGEMRSNRAAPASLVSRAYSLLARDAAVDILPDTRGGIRGPLAAAIQKSEKGSLSAKKKTTPERRKLFELAMEGQMARRGEPIRLWGMIRAARAT